MYRRRTLREFAGLCLAILGGLFALSWYRHQQAPNLAAWVAAALGLLIGVPGLIRPNLIRPVYLGAMALTKPIGHVVGLVLLAVVYYGVMTPLALAFRMTGRDGLGRYRWGADSYWVDHVPTKDVRFYLRQYQHQVADDRAAALACAGIVRRAVGQAGDYRRALQSSVPCTPRSETWINLKRPRLPPTTSTSS